MGPAPSWGPAPSCVTPPPSSLLFPVSPLWSHLGALAQCPPPSHPPARCTLPGSLTCDLVHQDARSDDAAVLGEELLHLFLAHGLREPADVQVRIPDGGGAGSGIGHLGEGVRRTGVRARPISNGEGEATFKPPLSNRNPSSVYSTNTTMGGGWGQPGLGGGDVAVTKTAWPCPRRAVRGTCHPRRSKELRPWGHMSPWGPQGPSHL